MKNKYLVFDIEANNYLIIKTQGKGRNRAVKKIADAAGSGEATHFESPMDAVMAAITAQDYIAGEIRIDAVTVTRVPV